MAVVQWKKGLQLSQIAGLQRFITTDTLFSHKQPPSQPYLKGGYDLYRNATKKDFRYLYEETGLEVLYSVDNRQVEKLPNTDENQYKIFAAVLRAKLPEEISKAYKENKVLFNTVQSVIALARLSDLPDEAVHTTGNSDARLVMIRESDKIKSELLKKLANAKDFDIGCKAAVFYSLCKADKSIQPTDQLDKWQAQLKNSYEDLPVTHQAMLATCIPSMNLRLNDDFPHQVFVSIERIISNRLFIPGELRPRFIANVINAVAKNDKYFTHQNLIHSLVSQISRMKQYPMILSPKTLGILLEGLGMLTFDITYSMQQDFYKSIIIHRDRLQDECLSQVIYGVGRLGFLNNPLLDQLDVQLVPAIGRFNGLQLFRCLKGMEEGGVTPSQDLLQLMLLRFQQLRKSQEVQGVNTVRMIRVFRILGHSKEECMQMLYHVDPEKELIGKVGDLNDFDRRSRTQSKTR